MPINYETLTGYYDGIGVFHPNTALTPSAIPNVATTYPINANQNYDWMPVYYGYDWMDLQSDVQTTTKNIIQAEQVLKVPTILDLWGQFTGGVVSATTMGTLMPFALGLGALYIFRKPIGKLIK